MTFPIDLSIVIPALNEGKNLAILIPKIKEVLRDLRISFEIVIVDGGSKDETFEVCKQEEAKCFLQKRVGYGGALRDGFFAAKGSWIITLDADLSHPPELIKNLWEQRKNGDIVIGSRFIDGGGSEAPQDRKFLSRVLNIVFGKVLAIPVSDSSSGYRLYKRTVLKAEIYEYENFNILQEVLVRAFADGFSIAEIPLHYLPRGEGKSHVSLVKFAFSYLPTLYHMWVLRHSITAADYEWRAYDSRHLPQRYWQRQRVRIVREFLDMTNIFLDVGCGSSRLADSPSCIALDIATQKLRFLKRTQASLIRGSALKLPFQDSSVPQVVCSQLLPYVEDPNKVFSELKRVLKSSGTLVIGAPDSNRISWKIIGFLYHHLLPNIFRYRQRMFFTRRMLVDTLAENGFRITSYRYIASAEIIIRAIKVE